MKKYLMPGFVAITIAMALFVSYRILVPTPQKVVTETSQPVKAQKQEPKAPKTIKLEVGVNATFAP